MSERRSPNHLRMLTPPSALDTSRHLLVPDTVEWSGKRPNGVEPRYAPIDFVSSRGWELSLPVRDFKKGRLLSVSTCTGLETPVMPFAAHAWAFLVVAEAAAEEHILRPVISRADFARDIELEDSVAQLRHLVEQAAGLSEIEIHKKSRQLGITFLGAAGGDRLRIYHKGLEYAKKHNRHMVPVPLRDVVRVELQCRKGQLADEQRVNIASLCEARTTPEPSEHEIPTIRTKPSFKHRIKRRHLWTMRRNRVPRRVIEATEAVNRFLAENGFQALVPGESTALPDPIYAGQ